METALLSGVWELRESRPSDFSVPTGEETLSFTMLRNGADGGILASGHLAAERLVVVGRLVAAMLPPARSGHVCKTSFQGGEPDADQVLPAGGRA